MIYLKAMEPVNEALYGPLLGTVTQIVEDTNEAVRRRRDSGSDNPPPENE